MAKAKQAPVALTVEQIVEIVDKLGALQAQIAPLEAALEANKASLKAQGLGRYEGNLFEANVFAQLRQIVDWKAIAEKVGYSHQLLAAHTTEKPTTVLKVTARKVAIPSAA